MKQLIKEFEESRIKNITAKSQITSGDTVRVHQKIKEGKRERTQVFEGVIVKTRRMDSLTATIWVRRVASGIGVEKSFLIHSPLIDKVEIVKRSKVRRNYLSYLRERSGKSARMTGVDFHGVDALLGDEVEKIDSSNDSATDSDTKQSKDADVKEEKAVEEPSDKTDQESKTTEPK